MTLGICAVRSGTERRAQRDIEQAGFGTRVLSFRVTCGASVQVRPLIPGLIFTSLEPGYGQLDDIDGVHLIRTREHLPLRLSCADESKLDALELSCLMGEFNKLRAKNQAGRFVATPAVAPKQSTSRKPRPTNRLSRRAECRRRERERKAARQAA